MIRYFSRLAQRSSLSFADDGARLPSVEHATKAEPLPIEDSLIEVTTPPKDQPVTEQDKGSAASSSGDFMQTRSVPSNDDFSHRLDGTENASTETHGDQVEHPKTHDDNRRISDVSPTSDHSAVDHSDRATVEDGENIRKPAKPGDSLSPDYLERLIDIREVHEVPKANANALADERVPVSDPVLDSPSEAIGGQSPVESLVDSNVPSMAPVDHYTIVETPEALEFGVASDLTRIWEPTETAISGGSATSHAIAPQIDVQIGEVSIVVKEETPPRNPKAPDGAPTPRQQWSPQLILLRRHYIREG
jgi:hypothetical protein